MTKLASPAIRDGVDRDDLLGAVCRIFVAIDDGEEIDEEDLKRVNLHDIESMDELEDRLDDLSTALREEIK